LEVAKKLQIREGSKVAVVNAPSGVQLDVETATSEPGDVVLVFAKNQAELQQHAEPAVEAARADRLSWIVYPKARQLGTDLNRDVLWKVLDGKGIRPVRQISIDDVWSAMRFRPGSLDQDKA